MSIGSAVTIEPYLDDDGFIGFISVLPEGSIYDYPPGDWERMEGQEKAILEQLANNSQKWKLPLKPDCLKYETKWTAFRDGVIDEGKVEEAYEQYVQDVCSDIASRIRRFLHTFCHFEDERHYSVLASFVIQSYFKEQFSKSPILLFDGVTGSGKSTALTALKYLCYRGFSSSNYSCPSLVEEVSDHDVTLLLDESLRNLSSERGADLNTLLINGFDRETAIYNRKDMKTYASVVKNHYTCVAVTTLDGNIPMDLRNRSMMITMALPDEKTDLEDIAYLDDAELDRIIHPDVIRTDLYALKMLTDSERITGIRRGGLIFERFRHNTKRRLTREEDGRYGYGHIHDILYTPKIEGRNKAIAYVHYTIGQATTEDKEILEYILDNLDSIFAYKTTTTESVLMKAYAELIIERHHERNPTIFGVENVLYEKDIMIASNRISLKDIHNKYRELRGEEGWDMKEIEPSRTLTNKFKKLRIPFEERGGRINFIHPTDPDFLPHFWKAVKQYLDPETAALFRKI